MTAVHTCIYLPIISVYKMLPKNTRLKKSSRNTYLQYDCNIYVVICMTYFSDDFHSHLISHSHYIKDFFQVNVIPHNYTSLLAMILPVQLIMTLK